MSREYFNDRANVWDQTVAEKDVAKLADMARRVGLRNGAIVLDAGTGTGVLLPFLLKEVGDTGLIFALDFAELMLKQARSKSPGNNIAYLLANISHIPARPESFDAVVCYSCFPHFPDKLKTLVEIGRTVRTGGRLVICHTSSRDHVNRIHHQIPSVQKDLLPDETEMRRMLSAAGFTGIVIEDGSDSYLAVAEKSHSSSRLMSSTFGE
jgi:ubiquinone/menaquinone biosynthesis C-methylase UbiE